MVFVSVNAESLSNLSGTVPSVMQQINLSLIGLSHKSPNLHVDILFQLSHLCFDFW